MITGIGIDIEETERLARMITRWGRTFTEKLFSAGEIAYCESRHHPPQHFAARFAAKEAFAKAIGTGWADGFRWLDVEVVNEQGGRPVLYLAAEARKRVGASRIHLSIAHSRTHVTAVVVIESPPDAPSPQGIHT